MICYFMRLFLLCILASRTNGVTIPISKGNPGRAIYTVNSGSLLQELQEGHSGSSDNTYDDPLTSSANNSTLSTATVMNQIIHDGNNRHKTVEYLGRVSNPGVVAEELESAAKYLSHQADVMGEKGVNEDGNADMTRVLDGFVILNNLYDSLVRPGNGSRAPTIVSVEAIISPWFSVNEQRNEMTVTVTLVQNWTDERLAYISRLKHPEKFEYVTLTSYMNVIEIWLPDNVVLNEKRCSKHEVTPVRITPRGDVSKEQRMSVTVNCPFFKNQMFPFDSPKCSVDLASFSWKADQVLYKWGKENSVGNLTLLESNGFRVKSVQRLEKNFTYAHSVLKSGLVLEFHLERNLLPYITKLYMPLGCFCLIAIAGLLPGVGPEIGSGLSYFMFGLMSIFMAISFNGPDFNWGNERTRLDTYYVLCVITVFLTGIVNMFRLKGWSSSKSSSTSHESYEMHTDEQDKNVHNNGSSTSTSAHHNHTRLWGDSDNFIDDDDYEGGVGQSGILNFRRMESVKRVLRCVNRTVCSCCLRINDFSVSILLSLFISWNSYYWISNLNK